MAVFAVRIIAEGIHEGATQRWGNTYHYKAQSIEPFPDLTIATAIADAQRLVMASTQTIKAWQTWGPTDGDEHDNVMRENGAFSKVGSALPTPGMYTEACAVVAWPLPRSPVHNRRRWCRKFIRQPGNGTAQLAADVAAGRNALDATTITALQTYANAVDNPSVLTVTYNLCTKDGVEVEGTGIVRPFIKTREIGR